MCLCYCFHEAQSGWHTGLYIRKRWVYRNAFRPKTHLFEHTFSMSKSTVFVRFIYRIRLSDRTKMFMNMPLTNCDVIWGSPVQLHNIILKSFKFQVEDCRLKYPHMFHTNSSLNLFLLFFVWCWMFNLIPVTLQIKFIPKHAPIHFGFGHRCQVMIMVASDYLSACVFSDLQVTFRGRKFVLGRHPQGSLHVAGQQMGLVRKRKKHIRKGGRHISCCASHF